MKKNATLFNALKVATDAGFRGMHSSFCAGKNVVPLLYLKNKNPRKLFTCKGFKFIKVVPLGIEPRSRVSETRILSVVLWDQENALQRYYPRSNNKGSIGDLTKYKGRYFDFWQSVNLLHAQFCNINRLAFPLPGKTK